MTESTSGQGNKGGGETDALTPRRRVNKINDLLDQLPETQRASLMSRLEGTAPQLISPEGRGGRGGKPIDTPMRRAKAIARRLTRGELPRDAESPSDSDLPQPAESPAPSMATLRSLKGRELSLVYNSSPLSDWLTALKIAEIEVKEHLLIYLPPREKTALEDALRQLGPVKLIEAQEASERVMRRAETLSLEGKVSSLVELNDDPSWLD